MTRALLVIDVQNDFCPDGALAVPAGDEVVAIANSWMQRCPWVVLTQDWHPPAHASFASTHDKPPFSMIELDYGAQTLWPDHCIQGTTGAAFHADLQTDRADLIIRKGHHPTIDSYSAFFENDRSTPTGLGGALRERGVDSVVLVGLATDYCVKFTALDARRLGFDATVVRAGVRGIAADSVRHAWSAMREAGVVVA